MASAQDYKVGASAAQTVIEADIDQEVPAFFRDDISPAMISQIAASVAKAVIDAVDAARAKADAAKGEA
jgi:hypothetical protein